jgi:hypothetical protein
MGETTDAQVLRCGGEVKAIENLATVCARCQYQMGKSAGGVAWMDAPCPTSTVGRPHGFYEPVWRLLGKQRGVRSRWLAAIRHA